MAGEDEAVERRLAKEDVWSEFYKNRVNAGLHVTNRKVLDLVHIDSEILGSVGLDGKIIKVDLEHQILSLLQVMAGLQ